MKRALVIDAHLHCTGQENAEGVLQALDEAGIDMAVLLAPFLCAGYSMHDAASLRRGNAWSSVRSVLSAVRAGGMHLLHAHLPNAHAPAGLAGRLAGKPVLTTIHGHHLLMADLEMHCAVGSHPSVACRQSGDHALGLGVGPALPGCEPNGVDTTRFSPGRCGGLRAALGLAEDALQVGQMGQMGRMSPEKGPEVFVRAALQLRTLRPQVHMVRRGDGPMGARARARAVQRMGLDDSVARTVALLQRLAGTAAGASRWHRPTLMHTFQAAAPARRSPTGSALPCPPRSDPACCC